MADSSTTALQEPREVTISCVTMDSLVVNWKPSDTRVGCVYLLEQGTASGAMSWLTYSWTPIAENIAAVNHNVTGLTPGTTYVYRVTCVNGTQRSTPCQSVPVTTLTEREEIIRLRNLQSSMPNKQGPMWEKMTREAKRCEELEAELARTKEQLAHSQKSGTSRSPTNVSQFKDAQASAACQVKERQMQAEIDRLTEQVQSLNAQLARVQGAAAAANGTADTIATSLAGTSAAAPATIAAVTETSGTNPPLGSNYVSAATADIPVTRSPQHAHRAVAEAKRAPEIKPPAYNGTGAPTRRTSGGVVEDVL